MKALSPAPVRITQLRQRLAQSFPHIERHRVAFFRIVEGDDANPISNAFEDFSVGERCFIVFAGVEHGMAAFGLTVQDER
jgi:hypothetical protein